MRNENLLFNLYYFSTIRKNYLFGMIELRRLITFFLFLNFVVMYIMLFLIFEYLFIIHTGSPNNYRSNFFFSCYLYLFFFFCFCFLVSASIIKRRGRLIINFINTFDNNLLGFQEKNKQLRASL